MVDAERVDYFLQADFLVLIHSASNRIAAESPTTKKPPARFDHLRILAIVDLPLGKT